MQWQQEMREKEEAEKIKQIELRKLEKKLNRDSFETNFAIN
jgi:hypothetical protein